MNVIMISGILEKMETKVLTGGNFMAKFLVVAKEDFLKKSGEPGSSRAPFDCIAWNKLAQHVERWEVGSYVEVSGKMQLRVYTPKGGGKKWNWELMAARCDLVWQPSESPDMRQRQPSPGGDERIEDEGEIGTMERADEQE